jgi:hypothetical protein
MTRCNIDHCEMKITTLSKVASLAISSVMIQTAVAGHDFGIGVGPTSGGGESGGGILEMLFASPGSHSVPASGGDAHERFPARHSATGKRLGTKMARNNHRMSPTDKHRDRIPE